MGFAALSLVLETVTSYNVGQKLYVYISFLCQMYATECRVFQFCKNYMVDTYKCVIKSYKCNFCILVWSSGFERHFHENESRYQDILYKIYWCSISKNVSFLFKKSRSKYILIFYINLDRYLHFKIFLKSNTFQ